VSTGSQLEEVEAVYTAKLNSGEVTECLFNSIVLLVDNKRSTTKGITTITHLTLSCTDLLGISSLLYISKCSNSSENILGSRGLLGTLETGVKDKRDLRNLINPVSTSHDKSGNGRCSKSRCNSILLLARVDLSVPLTPSLGGSKHASSTTHISESSLSGTRSTSSSNTSDTSYSTSGSPGLCRDTHTSRHLDSVCLTVVLVHVGVHELYDIGTDGCEEYSRERGGGGLIPGKGEDGNNGTCRHFESVSIYVP